MKDQSVAIYSTGRSLWVEGVVSKKFVPFLSHNCLLVLEED